MRRLFAASVLSAMLFLVMASAASADEHKQEDHGREAPEVPLTAAIPAVAVLGGAGYYLVTRRRRGTAEAVRVDASE